MTSEEIIQRLLDEKKISVKEAIIILKDLARIGLQQIFIPQRQETLPWNDTVVMYGIGIPTSSYVKDGVTTNANTIKYDKSNESVNN